MILINTLNRPQRFLVSTSYIIRQFSIMEYYRSVRPVPMPEEKLLSVPKPKEVEVPEISHKIKRSTRPYVGPQIETRQPVPIEVNVNIEKNVQASTVSWIAPKQPKNPKFLKVALLGLPNSGKSSFLNTLLNSTISAVSPKVNTTSREDIKGVLTVEDTQVVVIDSPGKQTKSKIALGIIASHKRRKFCKGLVKIAWRGLEEADVCLFIVDVVKRPKSDLYNILRALSGKTATETYSESVARDGSEDCDVQEDEYTDSESQQCETKVALGETDEEAYDNYSAQSECTNSVSNKESDDTEDEGRVNRKVPVALILNKIDLASHRKWVKSRVRELKVHGNFCDIFYISAKHGIGFLPVINFLKKVARPGPWIYPPDMVTTLSKVKIVEQLVRTYIFCWFNKDVPYKVEQNIIGWTYSENGSLNIEMLYVTAVKVAKMICGVEGRLLKQLQKNVSSKLSRMWNELVFVFIHIKVK
ncbi:GTPase [Theileria orientalis strain Shintoku]|uniref:GTPase n=1 Tax=Theileria orientalis strain Shintoku TaxID=869250 RepID=J4DQ34_THEOR|nr:GTPase [Theileria orientalis strain Shintoku]BAM41759.1 GTPase [Theileria orientalis strain Shintoku]|eukprot:XP_009692060.1 GTPase [Theileria orientalis strain Shintoku]